MTKLSWLLTYLQTWILRVVFGPIVYGGRKPPTTTDIKRARSILVFRTDEIGDFVLTTPLLEELRRLAPQARICVVVKPEVAPLAHLCESVDSVIEYDQRSTSIRPYLWPFVMPFRAHTFAWRANLRAQQFDIALLPRFATDSAYATFAAYLSGAPIRVGFSEKTALDKAVFNHGFDSLLTHVHKDCPIESAARLALSLLKAVGVEPESVNPKLVPKHRDLVDAKELIASQGVRSVVALGVSPGHSELKQWPLASFAQLGKRLTEECGAMILIVASSGETEAAQRVCEQIGSEAMNLAGKMSLQRLAAVLALCDVYIGNDTGPTHISAAVGTKTIALFGASCAHIYRPIGKVALITRELECGVCQGGHLLDRCYKCIYDSPKCMEDIGVDEVFEACKRALRENDSVNMPGGV